MARRLLVALLCVAFCSTAAAAGPLSLTSVRAALPTWEKATRAGAASACTTARLLDGGDTPSFETGYFQNQSNNSNLIVWRTGLCSKVAPSGDECVSAGTCPSKYRCWDDTRAAKTIALTTVTYSSVTGEIFDADMELFGWDGTAGTLASPANPLGSLNGWYFTCTDPPRGAGAVPPACSASDPSPASVCTCAAYGQSNCIFMDVQNTVTHEMGHVLGLDHPDPFPSATMSASATPGETAKRTLSPSDVAGICAAYPLGYVAPGTCVKTGVTGSFTDPDGYWKRTVSASGGCVLWWPNPHVTMMLNQYGAGPSCGDPAPPAPSPQPTPQPSKSSGGCATAGSQPTLLALLLGGLALRLSRRRRAVRVTVSSTRSRGSL